MKRSISRLVLLCALAVTSVAAPGRAHAQPQPAAGNANSAGAPSDGKDRALVLLSEGNRKLDQGLYLEALSAFQQAYGAFPSPRLHFNIAQTLHELGRPLEALRHYEDFLAGVKEDEMPSQWTLANERIFELQSKISPLTVQCNVAGATVSIDGVASGTTPLSTAVRLMPGRHIVLIDKPGYERRVVELELDAGEPHTERVELLTSEAALAQRQEFQRAEAARKEAELRLSQEKSSAERDTARRRATLRTSAWISLGIGAAALATSAVTGTIAWREYGKVEDSQPGTPWAGNVEDHYERAISLRRISYISAAVGAVGLVTGGGLLLYSSRGKPSAPVERAALVPVIHARDGGGVAITGAF